MRYWFMALGIGPLVGGPVGLAVGKQTDNMYYGISAGVAASYLTNTITIGGVLQRTWAASNFVRFGTATATIGLGQVVASAAYGYALGATVGTGLSWLLFGEEGRNDAIKLYTSPVTREVSLAEWAETVSSIPSLLAERSQPNYAVAGNAGGYAAGTQINPNTGRPVGDIQESDAYGGQALLYAEAYGV